MSEHVSTRTLKRARPDGEPMKHFARRLASGAACWEDRWQEAARTWLCRKSKRDARRWVWRAP